jgi:hypothetical protein
LLTESRAPIRCGEPIPQIDGRWPDTRFTERRVHLGDEFVVEGWTAPATRADGRQLEWMGSEAIESCALLVCANYV